MKRSVLRHRRRARNGWVAATVGIALVAVGATAVVILGPREGGGGGTCARLTIAASPDQAPTMTELADQWASDRATDTDRCVEITVEMARSGVVAATLSPDAGPDGLRPDVWVPESSIWPMVAAAQPGAAGMLPGQPAPSLASSPVVLAMQQPMAEALGWPEADLGWTDLLGAFAGGQTWEQFGEPEWGPLQLGIADPTGSTAGIASILTALDPDGDGTLSDEELLGGIALSQLMTVQEDDTDALLSAYTGTGGPAHELPAAFPVLERDLAAYRASGAESAVPLVPIYVREGVVFADYPYLVLQASWVDEERRQLAGDFLAYLQGASGRQAYAEAGFRDPQHSAGGVGLLSEADGFAAQIAAPVRTPTPEALGEILGMWPVLVRSNNILIVLDTSGSMSDEVPGTDQTRIQLLRDAALQGIGLLNDQTTVGLWEFATELTPTTPYRVLVPTGPADEDLGPVLGEQFDGVDRRQAMAAAIQGLRPAGGTGLYDTVHDAYLAMQEVWQAGAQNLLVVITDGRDEDHDGRTLPELLDDLGDAVQPDRPLPIIALAVGPEVDAESLEQITQVTGGRMVVARDDVSAIQQVILAFAGRIS